MSGDTWVPLDGRDPTTFYFTCWISDCGPYIGPLPPVVETTASWVPSAADQVRYLFAEPNPSTDDSHVADGTYSTDAYEDVYIRGVTPVQGIGSGVVTSAMHLFVVWFDPAYPHDSNPAVDPALLTTPSALPLDLVAADHVTGGRLGPAPTGPTDLDALSFGLCDTDGTWIGSLIDVQAGSWQHELSAPGSLTCRVAEDDPLYAELTPKRIVKAYWRGAARMAARIDSSAVDLAVDGRRWREFNQIPGALNMLADGIVYPEYGKDRSTSGQRWFGYMSKDLTGGNFTTAEGYTYNSDSTNKKGKPEGLSFPNPWWIAKNGPTFIEVGGKVQTFRRAFTTASTIATYQILATADDYLTLWLDGEKLYESDRQTAKEWRFLQQITGTLPAGDHLLAAKVVNAFGFVDNPIAFIMTMQEINSSGEVIVTTPVVNSDDSWTIADDNPGYHRGAVLATIFTEAAARTPDIWAFHTLTLGFTTSQDSTATDWADTPGEYALDVQSPVLDAVPILTEKALDVDVDFDTLTLNGYNRKGSDLSETVTLAVGVSVKVQRVERVEAKFNTALVQKSDGTYIEETNSSSVTAWGRIETGLQVGSTSETGTARSVAQGAFTENAATAYTFTVTASTLAGPQVYVDFNIGDTISLIDDVGTSRKVRVLAVTVDVSGEVPDVTLEVTVDRS